MAQFDDTFNNDRMAEIRSEEEEALLKALALQHGLQYVDLRGVTVNPDALRLLPESEARLANAVIFEMTRRRLSVAVRNPNDPQTKVFITHLEDLHYQPTIYMTSTRSLEHAWERYKDQHNTQASRQGILDIDTENIATISQQLTTPEMVSAHIGEIKTINNARRVSETLETVFAGAIALGASDIHIEPETTDIRLRYRLDGVLHDIINLDRSVYDRLMSRLKLLSGMILNIKDQAQDGRFSLTMPEKEIEVRSSVIPGAAGESIVMRLLDPTVASFSLATLGLNPILQRIIVDELKRPNGLILTTGPTGSGKTTALYAFLREVHNAGVKIITIENPVEYKLDGIVQTQVSDGYTFESGLRAILRQDPEVIMVGEIRDREVAETAIHAAETGHLVFSTLHTNSAVGAFPRLIDLGVDYRIMGSTVNIILGQRLVRVLCPACKAAYEASPAEVQIITAVLATHPAPPTLTTPLILYKAVGCEQCNNTGYHGRQGVYEAIKMDTAVEEAVIRDPREHIILAAAKPQGIPSMAEDGIERVVAGTTSLEELERVVDLRSGRHTMKQEAGPDPDTDAFLSHIV